MWSLAMMGTPEVLRVSDTCPGSAETSFRELDDIFLQTQTRIWLGEVLHVRLDEDVGIADLLADGELLFQVSKVVWKMLLSKHGELKHSKVHIYERASSGKSQGRYTPYPKIDSFLKICQVLGLTGIDLFSPSDAVDKRNVRRVCMCIRSLSKKAMVKKLKVPDFDIVTYTIAMPTNLVDSIRRNLEFSHCSSLSSNSSSPWNNSRESFGLKIPFGEHPQLSYSRSDETESFVDLEFESPLSSTSYDATDFINIVREISPELSSVDDEIVHKTCFMNSVHGRNHHEHVDEISAESPGLCYLSTRPSHAIPSSSFTDYDHTLLSQADDPYYPGKRKSRSHNIVPLISPSFTESEFECSSLFSMCSTCTEEDNENQENGVPNSNFKIDLTENVINTSGKQKNDIEVSSEIDVEEVDVSHHSYQITDVGSNMFEEARACFNFIQHSNSVSKISMSNYASKGMKNYAIPSHDTKGDEYGKDLDVLRGVESPEVLECRAFAERIPNFGFCRNDLFSSSRNSLKIEGKSLQRGYILPSSNHEFRVTREATSDESFRVEKLVASHINDAFVRPYNESQAVMDSTVNVKETIMVDEPAKKAEDGEGRRDGRSGNHVLKSVARIITIVGALVLLLHVRQKKDEEKNKGTVLPLQVRKQNQELLNRRKNEIGKSNSLYPAEKFKF